MASNYLGRLNIDFFSNHKLCKTDNFDKPVDFCVLFSNAFCVKFCIVIQALAVAGDRHRCGEDVMQVPEWGL